MGKIPRKLKKINGFVNCEFGPIPYEDDNDRNQLVVLAKIYNKAFKNGQIIHLKGFATPTFKNDTKEIRSAAGIIFDHIKRNMSHLVKDPSLYDKAIKLLEPKFFGLFKYSYAKI